jgi:predicted alpha-1,2-mannosidase
VVHGTPSDWPWLQKQVVFRALLLSLAFQCVSFLPNPVHAAAAETMAVRESKIAAAGLPDRKRFQHLANLPDPLVGTDSTLELSHGNTYPAVFVPFAMANWTAETDEGGLPYQYRTGTIRGFRSTHRPSAWMFDYGPLSLMPGTGHLKVLPNERASTFLHRQEDSRAWRYRAYLRDYGVQAEIAPSRHGGILRFIFPQAKSSWVVIDAQAGGSAVNIDTQNRRITGENHAAPKETAGNFTLWFVVQFDQDFQSRGTWDESGRTDQELSRSGSHAGAWIAFATKKRETVTARVGMSFISLAQAQRNLEAEMPTPNFEEVAEKARREWDKSLGSISLDGGTSAQKQTFYTALYRALQMPRLLNETDSNGETIHYSPYDGRIHPGPMLADTGFWDTYRAEFPLLALIRPRTDAELIRAMLNCYDEAGWIPKWPNPAESNGMIATHADSVIADAYTKGIRDFDVAKAYAAIRKDGSEAGTGIFEGRGGILDYLKMGYLPADRVKESVSRTLEYSYDDFCLAQMALALGKDEDYRDFRQRSRNYRNVFDLTTGFMRGRNADGSWVTPFDPLDWGGVYTEGNAWQWLWSVQHDVAGLIELLGGKQAFARKLDTLFTMTSEYKVGGYGRVINEMREARLVNMGQYAHNNEPSHHVIYLYDFVGQPWKAQKLTHQVMERLYGPGPGGWLGEEDTGEMSSWYIFSALGIYPVNPGQPIYALSSPLFRRATINLENSRKFTIETHVRAVGDIYIHSVTLNGKPLYRPWITHSEITSGGVLHFELRSKPNKKWGTTGIPAPDDDAR